ncbi:RNA polymerase primary sigma factor [Bradyrhizobium sp. USDA 4341]
MRNLAVELRGEPDDNFELGRHRPADESAPANASASPRAVSATQRTPTRREAVTAKPVGDRTAITQYFAEVGRHPLLTRDGEIACGLRMQAGKFALFEALSAWPGVYQAFRNWRRELEQGASPYRLRAIGDGADGQDAGEIDADLERDDADTLEHLFEQHRADAIVAIGDIIAYESGSVGRTITGRSEVGIAIANYGLLTPQFKELVDAILSDGKDLSSIDLEAARIARKAGFNTDEFRTLWLSYNPLWGGGDRTRRPDLPPRFEGQIEFAAILSKLADFARRLGMAVPAFRKALTLARSGLAIIEEAKNEMVCANTRLVISFANQLKHRGVSFDDLIQEGNIGLLRAVDGYDHSLGYRFAAYASWWILVSMKRAIADQSRTIRYPIHLVDKMSRVRAATLVFRQRNGRQPTEQEIIEATGLKPWIVKRCLEAATTVSIDEVIGEDGGTTRGDLIEDTEAPRPDEGLLQDDLRCQLADILATLPAREAHILRHRFGLDAEERTFEQLGTEMSLCRERIRQLETKALRTLKFRAGSRGLRVLL